MEKIESHFQIGRFCVDVGFKMVPKPPKLIKKIYVPGAESFVVNSEICEGKIINGKEVSVGNHFKECFSGLVEQKILPSKIKINIFDGRVSNEDIIYVLNGSHRTTAFHFWKLLEEVALEDSVIAYIQDRDGVLQTVYAIPLNSNRLEIGAALASYTGKQSGDVQVISSHRALFSRFWSL